MFVFSPKSGDSPNGGGGTYTLYMKAQVGSPAPLHPEHRQESEIPPKSATR